MGQNKLPLPWNKAILAIVPGLFATKGLITVDFSVGMSVGLMLLFLFLFAGFWSNQWQLPDWGLMAAGMLISIGLTAASGLIGGLAAIMTGQSAITVVLLILLAILSYLMRLSLRQQGVSKVVWALSVLIVLCQLAVRIKYFVLLGVSWSVAWQWLNISLYAAVIALLFPVVLGIFVAQRYGQRTMLFVIGMIYVSFQLLIDVNYQVTSHIGSGLGLAAYKALIPFFFTVMAPLWFLRARSTPNRIGGMMALVGFAVIMDLLVVGVSYAGDLHLIIWISFIPYTVSVLSALALAYKLYTERDNVQPRV
jgi:hypothetical protein